MYYTKYIYYTVQLWWSCWTWFSISETLNQVQG